MLSIVIASRIFEVEFEENAGIVYKGLLYDNLSVIVFTISTSLIAMTGTLIR